MSVSVRTIKIVWGLSGSLCAICKNSLVRENGSQQFPIGDIAHIEGDKPGSKRYRENMSEPERNGPNNLLLLCPTDHDHVDKDDSTYTTEKLLQIKAEHEQSVQRKLQSLIPEVGFAELEVTLNYLIDAEAEYSETVLQGIPQKDKIKKNNLSNEVENLLRMGLMRKKEIDDYLNKNPDMNLSKKLRSSFIQKYEELKSSSHVGDELFYELLDFASGHKYEPKNQAAGLTVIAYYFHLCDVFES